MKVEISIDPTYKEPKVIILTDKMTDDIEHLMQIITTTAESTLLAFSHKGVELIDSKEIVRIYTEQKGLCPEHSRCLYGTFASL